MRASKIDILLLCVPQIFKSFISYLLFLIKLLHLLRKDNHLKKKQPASPVLLAVDLGIRVLSNLLTPMPHVRTSVMEKNRSSRM
jgi:hypothetical protein